MIAQITGIIDQDGVITAFVSDEDAEFFSVYVGTPGDYLFIEDYFIKAEAIDRARSLLSRGVVDSIDDRTFSKGKA